MPTPGAARILVVDDDDAVRTVVSRALREEGYDVVAVGDGVAALDAVRTADLPYDLVVSNNHMPRMGGTELVAQLRRSHPQLPILHLDDLSRSHQAELPADVPNLAKPFSLETLVAGVERLLAGTR
jgi:two-component system cell cycle sensor histidine kinase/response regulator CckA